MSNIKLTFNLAELKSRHIVMETYLRCHFPKMNGQAIILRRHIQKSNNFFSVENMKGKINRHADFENVKERDFEITTKELRNFLQNTFGIGFSVTENEGASNKRNQLNGIIKKFAPTERYKATKMNLFQYEEIIKSDEFTAFILRYMESEGDINIDEKNMYKELMFLQNNRYKETSEYKKEVYTNNLAVSNVFHNLFPEMNGRIKEIYCDSSEESTDASELSQTLREITYYNNTKIYPDVAMNRKDIMEINEIYTIQMFIGDINRWNNNMGTRDVENED